MSSLQMLNQDAEHAKRFVALAMNINAAKGLQEVRSPSMPPTQESSRNACKCSSRGRGSDRERNNRRC